jgi:hypothetical protein
LRHRRQADEHVGAQADGEQDRGFPHGCSPSEGNRTAAILPLRG